MRLYFKKAHVIIMCFMTCDVSKSNLTMEATSATMTFQVANNICLDVNIMSNNKDAKLNTWRCISFERG